MSRGEPQLVISLDFELHWGVFDHSTVRECQASVLGARKVIPDLLAMFRRFDVSATWATVGLLFAEGRADLEANLPAVLPTYDDPRLSAFGMLPDLGANERDDPFHFAPSLIREISRHPGQEIATHTFSHYYCLEPGQTAEQFESDLRTAQRFASRFDCELRSLVFPRNQTNLDYLDVVRRTGIAAYRGNGPSWVYQARKGADESYPRRLARLVDSCVPLSGSASRSTVRAPLGATDVPASLLLRPTASPRGPVARLRRHRILRAMSDAARDRSVFHLWWHPHNFGTHPRENLESLDAILTHFTDLRRRHGMRSVSMSEAARAA